MLRQLQKISSRDRLLLVLLVAMSSVLAIIARPVVHLGLTAWLDRDAFLHYADREVFVFSTQTQIRSAVSISKLLLY